MGDVCWPRTLRLDQRVPKWLPQKKTRDLGRVAGFENIDLPGQHNKPTKGGMPCMRQLMGRRPPLFKSRLHQQPKKTRQRRRDAKQKRPSRPLTVRKIRQAQRRADRYPAHRPARPGFRGERVGEHPCYCDPDDGPRPVLIPVIRHHRQDHRAVEDHRD
jgi:hypothetical protein